MAAGDLYHISGAISPSRRAVAFLGGNVDDGVQVDAFAAARTAAGDTRATIIAWIMVPDITGTYTIFGMGDANAVEFIHFTVAAGKLQCAVTDATVAQFDTSTTNVVLTPYKWHHVAFTQDDMPRFYVDGVLVPRTDSVSTDLLSWWNELAGIDGGHIGAADSIAGDAALTQEFKGAISDVKYYNTQHTDQQIADDYTGKHVTTGLIAWWKFDGSYVDSVTPATNNGTAVGDIILTPNYSEFTCRLRHSLAAAPVVADSVAISVNEQMGHAIVIKAA